MWMYSVRGKANAEAVIVNCQLLKNLHLNVKMFLGGDIGRVEMDHRYNSAHAHVCADRWIDWWIHLFRRKHDAVFRGSGCHPYDLSNQCCTSIAQLRSNPENIFTNTFVFFSVSDFIHLLIGNSVNTTEGLPQGKTLASWWLQKFEDLK